MTAGINNSLRQAERSSANSGKKIGGNLAGGIKSSMAGLAAGGAGLVAAVGFGALAKEAADAADSISKFKQTMSFAGIGTKDIEKAAKATQDYANKTVYGLADVQSTTAQLASNGIKDYVGLTKAAGNLNAVAGGNSETFKSVAMVLTQTAGAGKLTTENFNQIADAIPGASGPIQAALKKNGAYVGNFRDAMAKGQITADEFNKVIMTLGTKPVAVKAATSTQTFEGAIGNLKASVVTALLPAMIALQPVFSKFAGFIADKVIPAVQNFVGEAKTNIVPIVNRIRTLFTGVGTSTSTLGKTFSTLATFGKAVGGVLLEIGTKVGATVGPAFKSISAAVTTQFLPAFNRIMPIVQPIILFILRMLGGSLVAVIQGAVKVITGLITVISGVFNVIKGVLTGNWALAWAGVKQILTGALSAILGAIKIWFNIGILGIFKRGVFSMITLIRNPWGLIKTIVEKGMGAAKSAISFAWTAIRKVFTGAFNLIRGGFSAYFNAYKTIITTVWNAVRRGITTAWNAIRTSLGSWFSSIGGKFTGAFNGFKRTVSGVWTSIRTGVTTAWTAVRSSLVSWFTSIGGRFTSAFNGFKSTISGAWTSIRTTTSTAWSALKTSISNIWNLGIKPIFNALKNFITNSVAPAFKTGVDKIKTLWDGLKAAARGPVEFLVNTVYENGIRPMFNALPGPDLPAYHFATGGPVSGGTPGKDSVRALMMPGEHVLTAAEVKAAGGHKKIFALRRALLGGGLGKTFDPGTPRFANGGMLTPEQIKRGQDFARAQVGKPYVWGGVGPGGYDCSGFMSAITNVIRGQNPYSRIGGTGTFPWGGFKPGVGEFTIGSTNAGVGHMAGTLAGMPVESYGHHGPSVTHRGYNDPMFNNIAHLGAGGAAAAKSGGFFSVISDIKKVLGSLRGFLSGFSSFGEWGGIIKNVALGAASAAKNFINDKVPGPGPIPGGIFDSGGVLRPGQFAFNASNKPEAVFNNSQFRQFAEGRTANNNTAPRRAELVITNWDKGTGYFQSLAEDAIQGNEQFNSTRRRMG